MIRLCAHGRRLVLGHSAHPRTTSAFSVRNASLNSAIHRGIRRTKSISERGEKPFRPAYDKDRETPSSRLLGADGGRRERVRRPNHQQGLDVEDMVRKRPTPSSAKGQGRPSRSHDLDRRQGSSSYGASRSSFRDRYALAGRNEGTGRYDSSRLSFQGHSLDSDRKERTGGSFRDPPRRHLASEGNAGRSGDREPSLKSRDRTPDRQGGRERLGRGVRDRLAGELDWQRDSGRRQDYDHRSGGREPGNRSIGEMKDYNRATFIEQRERSDLAKTLEGYPSRSRVSSEDSRSVMSRPASKTPLSVPYSTASSEFLYGTSVVTAALRSKRRQMFKLYVYEGEKRDVLDRDVDVKALAKKAGVEVEGVSGDWLRLMDKMSTGRPHNGYVLEASPLPKLPVVNLLKVPDKTAKTLEITLGHQSKEDQAINGTSNKIPWQSGSWRYPLILLLDGILDPGNLGAILRSAYFLGVDAVAVSTRNSAPLSPVTLKASAGASESIPLLSVEHPGPFVQQSIRNGWHVYAAAPPPAGNNGIELAAMPNVTLPYISSSSVIDSPLAKHPCVIVLGGEGEGLRSNIRRKVSYEIGIEGGRNGAGGVDSLNVSVAAGLLAETFLRRPREIVEKEVLENTGGKMFRNM